MKIAKQGREILCYSAVREPPMWALWRTRRSGPLTRQGMGKMYCLAGVGGKVPGMVEKTRFAERRVVLDGCSMDCGKHSLLGAGITEFDHVRLYEHGFEKGKTPVNDENISKVTKLVISTLGGK